MGRFFSIAIPDFSMFPEEYFARKPISLSEELDSTRLFRFINGSSFSGSLPSSGMISLSKREPDPIALILPSSHRASFSGSISIREPQSLENAMRIYLCATQPFLEFPPCQLEIPSSYSLAKVCARRLFFLNILRSCFYFLLFPIEPPQYSCHLLIFDSSILQFFAPIPICFSVRIQLFYFPQVFRHFLFPALSYLANMLTDLVRYPMDISSGLATSLPIAFILPPFVLS